MKRKSSFGEFMTDVVNRADQISFEKAGCSLSDRYDAPTTVIKMIGAVASAGWLPFSGLAGLLSNPSYFAFAAALTIFIVSPIGIIVVGALVYWGGKDSIKVLYNNRKMVEDVKQIGDKYESPFEGICSDEEYESLVNKAANDLYTLQ